MTFAHPWFLLGTLAALIPLAIHLFDRRRPRTHPFAAIAFVLKSQRRTASRLKLRRILLYTLRTLILLAIPLALARPERRRPEAAAELKRGAAATAIVLDASLSMRARDAGEVLFAKAQGEARAAIRGLLPEEPANLVVCGGRAPTPTAPGFDRARLRTQVDEARPSFAAADLSQCLEWAARSLEESPVAAKRLVVISDFSAHAFRLDAPPPMVTSVSGARVKPDVVLRDVAGGRPTANLALVDLKVEPVPQSGPRAFQFTLTARNFSAEPVKNQEVSVRVNDRVVAKGFLDIPPQGTAQKALQHRFDGQGVVSGEVALAPDALEADDRRAFVVAVPRELRALVVNGSPQTVRYRDEAFFVEAALTAPGSPVQPTVRDVDAGYRENFSQYDLVLLLNAQAPSEETAARLRAFVDGGGGLFIALGDAADPDAYTRRLGALLPRPLRLVKTAATREEPDGARKAARIGQVNWEHPVFSLFQGDAREGLTGARFYRYTLLESEPGPMAGRSPSEVLAAYEDGAPAVAAARVGRGRVLLFTSTVDRDWSDFSLRTSFLPLMQRFSAYLCGALEERSEVAARVGASAVLRPDGAVRLARFRAPLGGELEARPQPDGTVAVGPMEEPGLYLAFDGSDRRLPTYDFTASTDPAESDLTRVGLDALERHFGQDSVTVASGSASDRRAPFWTWLILLATLAFIGEGALLRR